MRQGTPIDISSAPGSDSEWSVRAYEDKGGPGMGFGDGFDDAFDAYMDQEGKSKIASNLMVLDQMEQASGEVSDAKVLLADHLESDQEYTWAEALSNKTKEQLVGMWQTIARDEGGYTYVGDVPTKEELRSITATELAQELIRAGMSEARDNFERRNERVVGSFLDDYSADAAVERRTGSELAHDRHQMLADDATAIERVEPVFFRAKGWYGTKSSNVDGTVKDAFMRGKYKVTGMYRRPVPEPIRDHYGEDEIASTIKNIVIVDIELDEG